MIILSGIHQAAAVTENFLVCSINKNFVVVSQSSEFAIESG